MGSSSTSTSGSMASTPGKRHATLLAARKLKGALVADRGKIEAHARER